jgi:hypothetical protein
LARCRAIGKHRGRRWLCRENQRSENEACQIHQSLGGRGNHTINSSSTNYRQAVEAAPSNRRSSRGSARSRSTVSSARTFLIFKSSSCLRHQSVLILLRPPTLPAASQISLLGFWFNFHWGRGFRSPWRPRGFVWRKLIGNDVFVLQLFDNNRNSRAAFYAVGLSVLNSSESPIHLIGRLWNDTFYKNADEGFALRIGLPDSPRDNRLEGIGSYRLSFRRHGASFITGLRRKLNIAILTAVLPPCVCVILMACANFNDKKTLFAMQTLHLA